MIICFLILTLAALAGCKGDNTTTPDYPATATASAHYYQTQAAVSLANATLSAGETTHSDAGTFPFAACIIALVVVAGMVFLFVQSRRRKGLPR
jgi:hypothetical protein